MRDFEYGFNTSNLDTARAIIQKHLDAAAAEMGIDRIKMNSITYSKDQFRTKVVVDQTVKKLDNAVDVDLSTMIGRSFRQPGKTNTFTLIGPDPQRRGNWLIQSGRARKWGSPGKRYTAKEIDIVSWDLV